MARMKKSRSGYGGGDMDQAAQELRGPCLTCNNAPACSYRTARGYDAIHCELYDGSVPSAVGVAAAELPAVDGGGRFSSPERPEGLCGTCVRYDRCRLPRPAGGVWHCQEYTST